MSPAPPLSLAQATVCLSLSHLSIPYWFFVVVSSTLAPGPGGIWLSSATALGLFHFLCLSGHSPETEIFSSQQLRGSLALMFSDERV